MAFTALKCLRAESVTEVNEETAIQKYMKELLTQYNLFRNAATCKNCKVPFWDLVAISARNEEQKKAFELQIEKKIGKKELPSDFPYAVFSDPEDTKIGNGGSTFHVLDCLHASYGGALLEMRILLIHAGGSSQRLPTASVLGKLFTPLPIGDPIYQMLDLKLALYLPFLKRMAPGILVTCSDDIETFWLDDINKDSPDSIWSFEERGFVALAHRSNVETGENHGVYVLPYANFDLDAVVTFGGCLQVLQKPSAKTMDLKGAIIEGFGVCTDSVFYFSKEIVSKLIGFYKTIRPLECEVDAYQDFLQALGTNANMDYIHNARNKSIASKKLTNIRQKLYLLLHNTPLNVLLLHWSRFFHLGTCSEYIENLTFSTNKRNLFQDLAFKNVACSKIVVDNLGKNENVVKKFPTLTVMHSIIQQSNCLSCCGPAVIEYCDLNAPVSIGESCLLSGCYVQCVTPVIIPSHTLMHTIAVNSSECKVCFVTVAFGMDDDLKMHYSTFDANSMVYFGRRMGNLLSYLGIKNVLELFDEKDEVCALWNAKLFTVYSTPHESFLSTLSHVLLINGVKELDPKLCYEVQSEEVDDDDDYEKQIRLSMADIVKCSHIQTMLEMRQNLHQKIISF
uniref:GDP-fucose pyrophosphorylase domain-containing protein n=1 Tax=Strigamia maritima TaxID=126957 RepID=T1JC87_STRMM